MSARACITIVLSLLTATGVVSADLILTRDGAPQATIIVAGTEPEALEAGQALQAYLERMSGAQVPLAQGTPAPAGGLIVIGRPEDLAAFAPPERSVSLAAAIEHDAFSLYCDGQSRLFISARKPVALVFGAYEVLQRLGCRWFFPGDLGEEIPTAATIALPAIAETLNPDMIDRNMWYAYGSRPEWQRGGYLLWQQRNRMGGVGFSAGHNLQRVVPPAVYGATHPEYFPVWNGARHIPEGDAHGWQPCTSNPEVIALAVAAARASFDERPEASSFSLSPADGYGWCECEDCRALDPPEQRDQRNQYKARRTLTFVNAVAREVALTHPDKYLAWYAYAGTVEPPTDLRAEPNVLTALAHYGYVGCNVHPMADPNCALNARFMGILDGWARAADRLMIREYWSLLCGEEDAMARVCAGYSLAEDLPLLVERGFIGASAESEPEYGSSALNFYLAAKLMWDSSQPLEPILDDYYRGMYGPAATAMRAFFEGIVQQCRARSDRGNFFADEDYGAMAAALAEIAATPGLSDKQRGRIAMTQAFLQYTTMLHEYGLRPRAELREQINAFVDGVEQRQEFTLDFIMHRAAFGRIAQAPTIANPEQYLVGALRLVAPEAMPAEEAPTLAPVVRGRQVIALLVQPGERLQAEVQLRRLGRYTDPVGYVVLDEAGAVVARGEANLEQSGQLDLPDAAPGTYTLVADAGSNAARIISPLRGMALAGDSIGFLSAQPALYFLVPAGVRSFSVALETGAPGETGTLQVLDPEGALAGAGDSSQTGQARVEVQVPEGMAGRVWSLRLGPAPTGVCEDLAVVLDGALPGLLSVDPARVLAPQQP